MRLLQPFLLTGALSVAFAASVAADLGGDTVTRAVDDLATVAAVALACGLCARAAVRQTGRLRLHWLFLAIGCGAWAVGESLWSAYDLISGSVPETSWADVAYLAALPPIAAALLVHPALRGRAIGKTRALIDGLVLAAAFCFAAWSLVLEPLRRTTDLTSLAGFVTAAYPLSDVVIAFLVVLVIRGTTREQRLDLWWLLTGVLLVAVSDAVYSYLSVTQSFSTGGIIDTGWFAGYLAIGVGALFAHANPSAKVPERDSRSLAPSAIVTPFLPILGALSLVAERLESGQRLDNVSLTVAFVLVGLVLLRQALLLADLVVPFRDRQVNIADRLLAAVGDAPDGAGGVRLAGEGRR